MKKNSLEDFINKIIKEYTGTGAGGGNAGDGNNITSPRPFPDDMSEIENYVLKNVYGAEGGQWVGDPVSSTFTRHPHVKFEGLKEYIREILKELEEQAYGSATLTTQGQGISGAPGVWEADPSNPVDILLQNTGVDENSIRINMEQAPPEGQEQGAQDQAPEAEEPKNSPEKIGKCQSGCVELQIENVEVLVKNAHRQIADIVKKSAKAGDITPNQAQEFMDSKQALEDQIEGLKEQIEELKEQQNEIINKKLMKSNVKKLWDDYATSRMKTPKTLNEHMEDHKKEAKRSILMEGVMQTFFEYFDQGHTNEEIVQLYAGKGVNVPEQFVSKARGQYESLSKLKLELEMSEKAFKNDASQIINNPATGEADGTVLDDDKQLASGLFK